MFEQVLHALATIIYTSSVFYIAPNWVCSLHITTLNGIRYNTKHTTVYVTTLKYDRRYNTKTHNVRRYNTETHNDRRYNTKNNGRRYNTKTHDRRYNTKTQW